MDKIKFYRGPKAAYDGKVKHLNCIYFATDTKELLLNGVNYGGSGVNDVTYDKNSHILTVSKSSGNTTYDLTDLIKFQSQLPDAMSTPNKIGGLNKGTTIQTLKTKTLSQVLEDILFEELQPSVTNPTCSVAPKDDWKANGIYEVNAAAPQAANFTKSFDRGRCTVVGQADKWRAGEQSGDELTYSSSTSLPAKITLGTMTYTYKVNHAAGDTLVTSKGNKATLTPNPLTAGSVTASTSVFGTYPYICNGQSASTANKDTNFPAAATPNTKLPLQKWTDTLIGAKFASEADTGTRLEFLYPKAKNITKVEFFNTVSGAWEIFGTDKYSTSAADNQTVQGVAVEYMKLTTVGAMNGALQLRFTVADAGKKLVDEPDTYMGEPITAEIFRMIAENSATVPFTNYAIPAVYAAATGNRPSGVAAFAVNFEPGGQTPLDARLLVPSKADLIAAATYSKKNYYAGMPVVVLDDGGDVAIYVLKDPSKITSAGYEGWKKVASGTQSSIKVINDLSTGGTTDALSAEQGKVIKDLIDTANASIAQKATKTVALKDVTAKAAGDASKVTVTLTKTTESGATSTNTFDIATAQDAVQGVITLNKVKEVAKSQAQEVAGAVYKVKGTKASLAEVLDLVDVAVGDVYNITAEFTLSGKKYPAGTNVVFVGDGTPEGTGNDPKNQTQWDALGGTVDLTPYLPKTEAESTYAKKTEVESTYAKKTDLGSYATKQELDNILVWNEELGE